MEHALQVKAKIPNPKDLEGKLGHGAAHHSQVGTNGKKNVYCQPSDLELFIFGYSMDYGQGIP